MNVTLTVKRLVDTPEERVIAFTLASADDGSVLYSTKSVERRQGVRSWSQAGVYGARSRVKSWCKRRGATIVEKPEPADANV